MNSYTTNGRIAIIQPVFSKIEVDVSRGFATNSNRINLVAATVVLGYRSDTLALDPGDEVILRGDAALQVWSKQKHIGSDKEFVLCPVSEIVGYSKNEEKS